MKNLLAAILLLATLPGCALLRSQVAVVHKLPKDLFGITYVMIPFKEQEGRVTSLINSVQRPVAVFRIHNPEPGYGGVKRDRSAKREGRRGEEGQVG